MSRHERKLKNFLINPKFQIQYAVWTTLTGLILVSINALTFYYYTSENYEIFIELNDITPEAKEVIQAEIQNITTYIISYSFIFIIISTVIGIVMSHKVAGPMYALKRTFRAIKSGDINQRINLRPKDKFQDVAQEFNDMMDEINLQ